jgi:hypothetical protein
MFGDGCNGKCEVEDGYVCTGGTPDLPDVCTRTNIPEFFNISTTDYNNLIVEFTEDISVRGKIINEDFILSIISERGEVFAVDYTVPEDAYYF